MTDLDFYLEYLTDEVQDAEDYKSNDHRRQMYNNDVADDEDYPQDKPERQIMKITPKQATAQQKTGHGSIRTEPGGQEIRLRGNK